MAKVVGIGSAKTSASQTIYDPTCGSGSLLLKAHDEARERTGRRSTARRWTTPPPAWPA